MFVDSIAIQLRRVSLELFLSGGRLKVPDCCLCEKPTMDRLPQLTSTEMGDRDGHGDSMKTSDPPPMKMLRKRSVVEDAEFLGLGRQRAALLSVFESPSRACNGTSQLGEAEKGCCILHKLCRCCTNYFAQVQLTRDPSAVSLPPQSQHRLHESLDGLRKSAERGCHFCSLILYNLGKSGQLLDEKDRESSSGVYLFYSCFQGRGRERVIFPFEQGKTIPRLERPTIYASLHPTGEALDTFIKPGQDPLGYLKFSPATSNGKAAILSISSSMYIGQ